MWRRGLCGAGWGFSDVTHRPFCAQNAIFPSPCAERAYLRTAAGINGLRRQKQRAAPSSMERLAPRFAFACVRLCDLGFRKQNHLPRWDAAEGVGMGCCVDSAGKCLHLPQWARLQAILARVCVEGDYSHGNSRSFFGKLFQDDTYRFW